MREIWSENSGIYAEDISFSTKIILFWKILIGKSKTDNVGGFLVTTVREKRH